MKMEKENISLSQLLTLLINFLIGSAIVIGVGGDPNVRLNDVIQNITSPGKRGVMVTLTIKGDIEKGASVDNMKKASPDAIVVVDSLAILKDDELIDFLSLENTRNYLWITNKIDRTSLSVDCTKDKYLGVSIVNTRTKSKGKLVKGRAIINLKVRAEGYLDGSQCKQDLTQVNTFREFGKFTEKEIKRNLEETIRMLQKDEADIFGFGELINRQDHKNFKRIEKNWDQYFKEYKVKKVRDSNKESVNWEEVMLPPYP